MASAFIVTRKTATARRFVVRYRLGGRVWPIQHGGSFQTLKEARVRRDFIAGELAAGRNPADVLRANIERPTRTFSSWAEAYRASRPDIGDETRKNMLSHLRRLDPAFGDRDPTMITATDVVEWIGANRDLKPSSLSRYVATLRQVLDFAGVEPNPARDRRVRLPKIETPVVEPPSAEQVVAIIAHSPRRWRLALRVLEQTGMRVGELRELEWRDVDLAESRFRIRNGKTATARRWVAVPEAIMAAIAKTCPPDDRTPERRVFVGFSPDVAKNVMARACKAAGIPHFHPHDLRHRYASLKIREGVPVTELAAQLGHSKKSLTLDTYSHVLIDMPNHLGHPLTL
jgi:integrase